MCGGPPARQQCPTTSRHGHGRRATFRALSSACSRLQVPQRTAVGASLHGPDISSAHGAYKLARLHTLGEGSDGASRTPRACKRRAQWRCDHRGVAKIGLARKVGCETPFCVTKFLTQDNPKHYGELKKSPNYTAAKTAALQTQPTMQVRCRNTIVQSRRTDPNGTLCATTPMLPPRAFREGFPVDESYPVGHVTKRAGLERWLWRKRR